MARADIEHWEQKRVDVRGQLHESALTLRGSATRLHTRLESRDVEYDDELLTEALWVERWAAVMVERVRVLKARKDAKSADPASSARVRP